MKPGRGAKQKGSAFEREVGRKLSGWLTGGERTDLFARNVLSGGAFTVRQAKGQKTSMPGDLVAAHPDAFRFLSLFSVECKHHADLGLVQWLLRGDDTTFGRILVRAEQQAASVGLNSVVIARQNLMPTFAVFDQLAAEQLEQAKFDVGVEYSIVGKRWCVVVLDHLADVVDPSLFLHGIQQCS